MNYRYLSARLLILSLVIGLMFSVGSGAAAEMTLEKAPFGETPDGKAVDIYTLRNEHGIEAKIATFEGVVVSLLVPDEEGQVADVVLGYDTLEEYIAHDAFFGGIADQGTQRFRHVVWDVVAERKEENSVGLELNAWSQPIDQGPQESIAVTVHYTLNNDNELKIEYIATTPEQETTVSLTNQIYFNLAGAGSGDILDHQLLINGESFYPLEDDTLKPITQLRGIWGTPMDYTRSTAIGSGLNQENEQIRLNRGYNHIWKLKKEGEDSLQLAGRVYEPDSKRVLELWTTEPGIWFETGNFLDGTIVGKGNTVYERHHGFTLTARDLSYSGDPARFPVKTLTPGEPATSTILYKFFTLQE
ncbi:hypothetical protein GF339_16865 [candidate division KSB3 bacterium]|uniref:Aldose 1-epimerase n=1 Tax=candidate division KSB3 bacterium TaxID=2044937 RepID=A0A9D5JY45_9BACT|nr:hypothetical protein [candidate division KSB3 bacterium]MBD3326260.1 hypothetical protein [candidate division KSB3 bacterium]